MKSFQFFVLSLGLFSLAIASPIMARTWNINPGGTGDAPTIQAGIDSANTGDLVLLADGTYTGIGNKDIKYKGKAITVESLSMDPSACIIDCEADTIMANRYQGFIFNNGESATSVLRGVTIVNGYARTNDGHVEHQYGGGIYCRESSPTINNCILRNNHAQDGGAVYCGSNSNPTFTECIFRDNICTPISETNAEGGGLFCSASSPILFDCRFENNYAKASGGAIDING